MKNFEIHITFDTDPGDKLPMLWTASAIEGDPDLGAGIRYYRTAHTCTLRQAYDMVDRAKEMWPNWIRCKIEHIMFDERRPR